MTGGNSVFPILLSSSLKRKLSSSGPKQNNCKERDWQPQGNKKMVREYLATMINFKSQELVDTISDTLVLKFEKAQGLSTVLEN